MTEEKQVKIKQEEKVVYHNFLKPGKIIKVKPIQEQDFVNQTVESLPDNFIHPNASRKLELHPDGRGSFTQIFNITDRYFTAEFPEEKLTELEWFSRMKGRDLNVHARIDNFWAGRMGSPEVRFKAYEVELPREGRDIDLGTIEGMLELKVLMSNTHRWIGPTWENRYDRPTYWFALVDDKIILDKKTEKMNLTIKASTEFLKIKDHRELLMEILIIRDPKNGISDSAPMDWIVSQVYEIVENNPKEFLIYVEDDNREEKVMVFKAHRAGAINKRGDNYFTLGDEPLGKLGEVVALLKDPTKADFRKKVEFQIEQHYKK